jgi:hypothetical protein
MFRFADVGKVWVPVPLPTGAPDEEVTIHLLLTLYTRKELRARERKAMTNMADNLARRAKEIRTPEDLQALFDETTAVEDDAVHDLLDRTSDWRGVLDDSGQPQEFSRERLASLLEYNWFFQAHRQALFGTSRSGVAKNSKPGPGGSPARVQA